MKRLRMMLPLLFVLCCSSTAFAEGKYKHLEKWANKYPLDYTTKPETNFFALPEIRRSLSKLLGSRNFKRLLKDSGLLTPINLVDGYLIIEGVPSNRAPVDEIENVIVAVNTNDRAGTIMVVFSGIGERFGQIEYLCTNGKACHGMPGIVFDKIGEWER